MARIFMLWLLLTQSVWADLTTERARNVLAANQVSASLYAWYSQGCAKARPCAPGRISAIQLDTDKLPQLVALVRRQVLRAGEVVEIQEQVYLRPQPGALPLAEKREQLDETPLYSTRETALEADDASIARALVHHWLALVDGGVQDGSRYAPLLADNWQLSWDGSAAPITSLQQLSAWLGARAGQFQDSSHIVDQLSTRRNADGSLTVRFELDWRGRNGEGEDEIARLDARWVIRADASGAWRILSIRQNFVMPKMETGARIKC